MTWQPIETAPKDANSLLLYIPSKGLFGIKSGFYVRSDEQWAWYGYSGKREAKAHQPTRWWDFGDGKPLPDPPA